MTGTTTLANEPAMLHATTVRVNGGLLVEVLASVLIQATDELYSAVRDLLVSHCHSSIASSTSPDPEWMFGAVKRQTFAVYDTCPGGEDHNCVTEV